MKHRDIIRRHIILVAAVLMMTIAAGCTHNDGDIGPLFGSWRLKDITVTGNGPAPAVPDVVWSFQSSVIRFQTLASHHDYYENWASWSLDGDNMTVNFVNHDDDTPESYWPYTTPPIPGFPRQVEVMVMHVENLTSSDMVLSYASSDGLTYTYKLKKIY